MSAAETLRKAADHIEQVGLNRSGGYFSGDRQVPVENRPCCALGAIAVVLDPRRARSLLNTPDPKYIPDPTPEHPGVYGDYNGRIHGGPEAVALQTVIDRHRESRGLWITAWSDYRAADAHEVADRMREAAADLEARA